MDLSNSISIIILKLLKFSVLSAPRIRKLKVHAYHKFNAAKSFGCVCGLTCWHIQDEGKINPLCILVIVCHLQVNQIGL